VDILPTVVTVSGKRVKLQCYDTAGQEQYRRSLTPVFVRNRDAYVLVYDVTSMESLRSLRDNWVPLLENLVQPGATFLLVGNKIDLLQPASYAAAAAGAPESTSTASSTTPSEEEQELVQSIIHSLQRDLRCHVAEHIRLSALQSAGVQDAVDSICRHIVSQKRYVTRPMRFAPLLAPLLLCTAGKQAQGSKSPGWT